MYNRRLKCGVYIQLAVRKLQLQFTLNKNLTAMGKLIFFYQDYSRFIEER